MFTQSIQKSIGFLVLVCLLCSFTIAYGAVNQFEVHLTVDADTIPPSIPTALSATTISSSQINLSWTASTDNVAVTGYRIYRNAVFVTTVVGTVYSDIGLSPSTTYTYTVSAIDASANESGQSAPASATTFSVSTPPVSTGGTPPSQFTAPAIYDLVVTPSDTSATISWKTTQPTTGRLSWGLSSSYELGVSQETIAGTVHSVTVTPLSAATLYQFVIDAVDGRGVHASTGNQTFQTLSLPSGRPNAQTFTATAQISTILLAWKVPARGDVAEVRIMKSDSYFPADPSDGTVVYEGNDASFSDSNVAVGTRYYYTLFVKYIDGSYSSGLVATARIVFLGETPTLFDIFGSLPSAPHVDARIAALTFLDFDFIQNGKKIPSFVANSMVSIDGGRNLTVSLDYAKVPELLKTIVITLSSPDDSSKTFSFLLRVNADKTAFDATIAPLGVSGQYGVKISIVDFRNRGLKQIIGTLVATVVVALADKGVSIYFLSFVKQNFLNFLLSVTLLAIIWRALKAMTKRDKQKEVKTAVPIVPINVTEPSLLSSSQDLLGDSDDRLPPQPHT